MIPAESIMQRLSNSFDVKFESTILHAHPRRGENVPGWEGVETQTFTIVPAETISVTYSELLPILKRLLSPEMLKRFEEGMASLTEEERDTIAREIFQNFLPNYPFFELNAVTSQQMFIDEHDLYQKITFYITLPDVGSDVERQLLNISCTLHEVVLIPESDTHGEAQEEMTVVAFNIGFASIHETVLDPHLNIYSFVAFVRVSNEAGIGWIYAQFDDTIPNLGGGSGISGSIEFPEVVVKTSRGTVVPVAV